MKLNEFKEINEIDMSNVLGSFGAAALQQTGNRLTGSGEGQLSVKDRMAKNTFISDFVGRATTNLASAIQSGLVDPSAANNNQPIATATTPAAGASVPGETPEQKRLRLQKAAQQNIDKTAMPFSKVSPTAAPTPDSIRQQKQATAAANAQQQMTPFNKLPSNQQSIAANNVRKNQQAVAGSNAQKQMAPFSKVSPAPAVWKNNRNPSLPAQRRPTMKENEFFKLNTVFESIVNIDEAESASAQTISQYVKNMVTKYLKGVNISSPEVQKQINTLANDVQSTYKQDKGKAALTKLANLGYSISYADAETSATNKAPANNMSAMDAFRAGMSGNATIDSASAGEDSFTQTKNLIAKLDNAGKQKVLSAIEQELETSPSAMNNMSRQLAARGQSQTSTGGATIATGKGIRHAASPTNPNQTTNIGDKISQANQSFKQRKVDSKALQRAKARKATA